MFVCPMKISRGKTILCCLFLLAVVLAVGNRFLPKPAVEVEYVVESYLLIRTLWL